MNHGDTRPRSDAIRALSRALLGAICIAIVARPSAAELVVDCSKEAGRVKPIHGGNAGPVTGGGLLDFREYHRAIALPLTRLHDCGWPAREVVDVSAVFPDFSRDPADPRSYRFAKTDAYVQGVIDSGAKVVYRLGESIEHTPRKYHVHPPPDAGRWAEVCLGIVRHYNEGWADGFHHGIEYWEIWNEPENRPNCWTGTDEQYLDLYETAARAIKARYPALKVGGPSLGHSGKVAGGRFEPSEFMLKFLARCRDRKLPLDFFSFHYYGTDPAKIVVKSKGVREALDHFGFGKTEVHLNEWNYLPDDDWTGMGLAGQGAQRERFYDRITNEEGAAFAAEVLIALQDAPVDQANYFTADNQGLGLFSTHGRPLKNYHAFKAFAALAGTARRVAATGGEPGREAVLAGVGADDGSEVRVLVARRRGDGPLAVRFASLPWTGPSTWEAFVVDAGRDLASAGSKRLTDSTATLEVAGPAVVLIKVKASR